jgi:hypothetical protein
MNCKKARDIMILAHYGEAGTDDKTRLDEHLRGCPACAAEQSETLRLFALIDEHAPESAPAPDWERVWQGVRAEIAGEQPAHLPAPQPSHAPWRRWAFAGPALALVLVAGILIGRFGLAPAPHPAVSAAAAPASNGGSPNGIRPAFAAYLEDLKPILLDYAHYVPGEKPEGRVVVGEAALRALMLQNVLLKRKLAEKDPAAADLLDDLDLILKEIVNRGPHDTNSPADIRALIEKRDVLFKMEILKKT